MSTGNKLEVRGPGYTQISGTLPLKFGYKSNFPPKAHIVIEMYDNIEEYIIPFKLNCISLMGTPMKLLDTGDQYLVDDQKEIVV